MCMCRIESIQGLIQQVLSVSFFQLGLDARWLASGDLVVSLAPIIRLILALVPPLFLLAFLHWDLHWL